MKIREVDTSVADQKSADVFFSALQEMWDLSGATALDMFARNGQLTVSRYGYNVPFIDLWELSEEHHEALSKFGPRNLKIGCSYSALAQCKDKYDLIVIDTPQGVHCDYAGIERFEHFDVLERLGRIMKPKCLVVVYVNLRPYDRDKLGSHGYDQYEEYNYDAWMKARQKFYGTWRAEKLTEEKALEGYRRAMALLGYEIDQTLMVPCYSDVAGYPPYAFRLGLAVSTL